MNYTIRLYAESSTDKSINYSVEQSDVPKEKLEEVTNLLKETLIRLISK